MPDVSGQAFHSSDFIMSDTSGRDDGDSENELARRIRESIGEAIGNDPSLRDLISEDGIDYLVRRAARRTIASQNDPREAIEQARRTYGEIARDLHRTAQQRRSVAEPRRSVPRGEVDRMVEREDRICGIFPWC